MDIRKNILADLKAVAPKRSIRLPRDLDFDFVDDALLITLHEKGVGYGFKDSKGKVMYLNMQDDGAAFEGWAIVLKTYWNRDNNYNVKLVVDFDLPDVFDTFINKQHPEVSLGHYGRFLYRAYKFREEFDWFGLDERIDFAVNEYMHLLIDRKATNHLQKDEAGINDKPEIRVEKAFSDNPNELIELTNGKISGEVHRQLDCWLESEDEKYQFLTSGKSAIDLWNKTNSTLNIFELKAKHNIKVGIITELFFYSEYCSDFYGKYAKFKPRQTSNNVRGYLELINGKIDDVKAYFLGDEYHPLVTNEAVKTLNMNRRGIEYTLLDEYDLKKMLQLANE